MGGGPAKEPWFGGIGGGIAASPSPNESFETCDEAGPSPVLSTVLNDFAFEHGEQSPDPAKSSSEFVESAPTSFTTK